MINFDDPGVAYALLAIVGGLRLALYVVERRMQARPASGPTLAPDDMEDAAPLMARPEVFPSPTLPVGSVAEAAGVLMPGEASLRPSGDGVGELAHPPLPSTSTPAEDEQPPLRFFTEILDSALIAIALVFLLIRPFLLQTFYIPSESMVPTLQKNDRLVAIKYTYALREPRRGEVVVFHAPRAALETLGQQYDPQNPVDYVKRVIGLPGDHIRIVHDDGVYINGHRLDEPYVASPPNYDFPNDSAGDMTNGYPEVRDVLRQDIVGQEFVVPPHMLFVLGDNRTMSHDSHDWGLLDRHALVGKALFLFWPLSRAGLVH
jgi:signal peptidase I